MQTLFWRTAANTKKKNLTETKRSSAWQNQQKWHVRTAKTDQPGDPPSLIRVFAVRMKKAWVLSYLLSARRGLRSELQRTRKKRTSLRPYDPAHDKTNKNGMCAQRRLRSTWASAQSDQSLRCPHEESLGLQLPIERTAKTQINLGIRQFWSESSLSAWRKLGSAATHWAHSEDSDQPGHPPSLIWVFAVRMKKAWVLSYPSIAQRRLWSAWADTQADLSLRWAHILFCWFCHALAHTLDWLQSFLFYIYFSLSLHYFFIMILFNPTSSYLWLNKNLSF